MTVNYFKTFDELADSFKEPLIQIEMSRRHALRAVWIHMRSKVRAAYWKYWPWWLKSKSSPTTPLLKTWKLRNSVSFRTTVNTVEVYSKMEWLVAIHEYWVTYKMSDKQRRFLFGTVFKNQVKIKWRPRKSWWNGMVTIPARPIWRRIISTEERNIEKIVSDSFENIFN